MSVDQVMNKAVEAATPELSLSAAKRRLGTAKIQHLVVMDRGRVTGLLSARDLGEFRLPASLGQWTVADLMSSPVPTVSTGTPVRRAAARMKGRSIGVLVVTSAPGVVAGIVTVADLLETLARLPQDRLSRPGRRRQAPPSPGEQCAPARPAPTRRQTAPSIQSGRVHGSRTRVEPRRHDEAAPRRR